MVGELGDVAPRAMQGNQSPLAYWLLWGWVQIAGVSEWSLPVGHPWWQVWRRLWPCLSRCAWTKSYFAALVAAFLGLAIEPYSIFDGGEVRVYAWVELLAVLHVMLFVELRSCERVACLCMRPGLWWGRRRSICITRRGATLGGRSARGSRWVCAVHQR